MLCLAVCCWYRSCLLRRCQVSLVVIHDSYQKCQRPCHTWPLLTWNTYGMLMKGWATVICWLSCLVFTCLQVSCVLCWYLTGNKFVCCMFLGVTVEYFEVHVLSLFLCITSLYFTSVLLCSSLFFLLLCTLDEGIPAADQLCRLLIAVTGYESTPWCGYSCSSVSWTDWNAWW